MKLIELTKDENYQIAGGYNTSLHRLANKECVVAYSIIDRLKYIVIKTKDCFKCYILCDLGKDKKYAKEVWDEEELNDFLNKKWVIINKEQFKTFKKEIILERLKC